MFAIAYLFPRYIAVRISSPLGVSYLFFHTQACLEFLRLMSRLEAVIFESKLFRITHLSPRCLAVRVSSTLGIFYLFFRAQAMSRVSQAQVSTWSRYLAIKVMHDTGDCWEDWYICRESSEKVVLYSSRLVSQFSSQSIIYFPPLSLVYLNEW